MEPLFKKPKSFTNYTYNEKESLSKTSKEPSNILQKLNSVSVINSSNAIVQRHTNKNATIIYSDKNFKFDLKVKLSDLKQINEEQGNNILIKIDEENYYFKSLPHLSHSKSLSNSDIGSSCII